MSADYRKYWVFSISLLLTSVVGILGAQTERPAGPTSRSFKHSPRPSAREWREASSTTLTQVSGERAAKCRAHRVREWLRVSCPELVTAAVRLVGGEARNAYFHVEAEHAEKPGLPGAGEFVIALRPGEQRVVQFWSFGQGYDGPLTVMGSITFQESWLEGDTEPTLLLVDVLHEPIRTATQDGK